MIDQLIEAFEAYQDARRALVVAELEHNSEGRYSSCSGECTEYAKEDAAEKKNELDKALRGYIKHEVIEVVGWP